MEDVLQRYESSVRRAARFYSSFYKLNSAIDSSDLEQAGRMAVWNVSQRRGDKINNRAYVNAAIKYSIFHEIRKMRSKAKNIYLTIENEEVPLVDLFPTNEQGVKRVDDLEEITYQVKHQFSEKESDSLRSLVEKCEEAYNLDLTKPPTAETKERVKIVSKMDLNDDEMIVYAGVLLGARIRFPHDYHIYSDAKSIKRAKERAKKFLQSVLEIEEISVKQLIQSQSIHEFLSKYRLEHFYTKVFSHNTYDFLREVDKSVEPEQIFNSPLKWQGMIGPRKISKIVYNLAVEVGEPSARDFINHNLNGLLQKVFHNSPRLALEFAFPGTQPGYSEEAKRLRKKLSERHKTYNEHNNQ